MRVMVTGATTPLGAAIVDRLLATPDIDLVLAVGREARGKTAAHDKLVYRSADVTHARPLHDLVWGYARGLGITAVVHTIEGHVDATRELVRACSDHPTIRRFVYRSSAEVYAWHGGATLVDENAPLELGPHVPRRVRDRIEADLGVCAHLGGRLDIAVLRCAEILAPDTDGQLWSYLSSHVCVHPFGFDPMINVLSLEDAAAAFVAAVSSSASGVFNIAGLETLPLSRAIAESMRINIGVPARVSCQFCGVLDGRRAREELGYVPRTPVHWPRPRWRRLIDELAHIRPEEYP